MNARNVQDLLHGIHSTWPCGGDKHVPGHGCPGSCEDIISTLCVNAQDSNSKNRGSPA